MKHRGVERRRKSDGVVTMGLGIGSGIGFMGRTGVPRVGGGVFAC